MNKFYVNDNIKFKVLKVIDNDGKFIGNMDKNQALKIAYDNGLDLVLINQNSEPPVAKILNYSKFKYELEKKEKDLKRKNRLQKNIMKEVSIRINTGDWDLKRIQKRIEEWIDEGYKVKVNMVMKGREIKFKNSAFESLKNFISAIQNSKMDNNIREEQRGLSVILTKI